MGSSLQCGGYARTLIRCSHPGVHGWHRVRQAGPPQEEGQDSQLLQDCRHLTRQRQTQVKTTLIEERKMGDFYLY